jgi:hypothetical protein
MTALWKDRKTSGHLQKHEEVKKSQAFRAGSPLRSPGFPVQLSGVGELRAAFLTESRIRHLGWYCDLGNPGPLQSHGTPGQAG